MRQVFTSPRLENVEAVAELLRAEGIEVRITAGRSYRGNRRSSFSYREPQDASPQPAAWIVHAEDQPRGRQLLREAGLLESSRSGEGSYLPLPTLDGGGKRTQPADKRGRLRMRLLLLGLIGIVAVLIAVSLRDKPATAPMAPSMAAVPASRPAPRPALVPQPIAAPETYRADVPTALAQLVIEQALAKPVPAQACVALDGKDPSAAVLQRFAGHATRILPASACPGADVPHIDVSQYLTDGTGTGNVRVRVDGGTPRVLEVERDGTHWRILRTR